MTVQQLIDGYSARIDAISQQIASFDIEDEKDPRLLHAQLYRAFISDLEKLLPDFEFDGVAEEHSEYENRIFSPGCMLYTGVELEPNEQYRITIKKL